MKKRSYKTPKGGTFRTYFHGNRWTNGCTFRKVPNAATDKKRIGQQGEAVYENT